MDVTSAWETERLSPTVMSRPAVRYPLPRSKKCGSNNVRPNAWLFPDSNAPTLTEISLQNHSGTVRYLLGICQRAVENLIFDGVLADKSHAFCKADLKKGGTAFFQQSAKTCCAGILHACSTSNLSIQNCGVKHIAVFSLVSRSISLRARRAHE